MCSNTHGSKFNMDYYMNLHFDLVGKLWGSKYLSAQATKGIATPDPDTMPSHRVVALFKPKNGEELQHLMWIKVQR